MTLTRTCDPEKGDRLKRTIVSVSTTTETDRTALRADAEQRVTELKAVVRRLWPDRDDSVVNSELVAVLSELRQAEAELQAVPA